MYKTCMLLALSPLLASAQTNAYDLGRIVVEGAPVSKYRVDAVSASTYFGAPPEELPVSVDVITEDFIREQNPADLHDLLFFQPGVSGGGKSMMDRTSGQYTIRGKAGSTPTFDGTLPLTGAMGMFLDPNALERVEVAKGPVVAAAVKARWARILAPRVRMHDRPKGFQCCALSAAGVDSGQGGTVVEPRSQRGREAAASHAPTSTRQRLRGARKAWRLRYSAGAMPV